MICCDNTTTKILRRGNVVKLADYEDLLWVVNQGFYILDDEVLSGWYLYQVNGSTILSFTSDLQDNAELVTYNPYSDLPGPYPVPKPNYFPGSDKCNCPSPRPYAPSVRITKEEKQLYDAAFVTVQSEADLERLDASTIPEGKLVRINTTDGQANYYQYNKETHTWDLADLQIYWEFD